MAELTGLTEPTDLGGEILGLAAVAEVVFEPRSLFKVDQREIALGILTRPDIDMGAAELRTPAAEQRPLLIIFVRTTWELPRSGNRV